MSLQVFQSARAALEATRGTSLTPTRILYAEVFEHGQEIRAIRPESQTGTYEGFKQLPTTGVESNTFHESGRESFEDLVWHANMFFAPLGTASGTAGAAYTYSFEPSGTADNIKTATVQMGWTDTIATTPGVQISHVIGENLTLHWEKGDEGGVTFDATYLTAGTATQITAFTGSLSARTTTPMSSLTTSVSLDAATIGATVDTNVIAVDWTLSLSPVPFYSLNNSAGPTATYRPKHRTWTAQITRQYASGTEWSIYQTKALRKVRILSTATNGTATVDLYGVYDGPREWSEVDGIITEVLTLVPGGTADPSFRASVITTAGTLV